MAKSSPLEELLRTQTQEAIHDSSGQFTIARDRALEKLAAFQLGSPHLWIVKIVQAAVASGSRQLDIRQTGKDTEFYFQLGKPWTLNQVEEAFYDPGVSQDLALDHLKRGLWSVAIQQARPFLIMLRGWKQSLFWTGSSLLHQAPFIHASDYLAVSCYKQSDSLADKPVPQIKTAEEYIDQAQELLSRAFTCPIPLTLDRRRLDALQGCPEFGCSKSSYPVYLGVLRGELPDITLPAATISGFRPLDVGDSSLNKAMCKQMEIPGHIGVMYMLTAYVSKVDEKRTTIWKTYGHSSTLFWIKDGVVIEKILLPWKESCVAGAIFASAQGLNVDVSGFKLIKDVKYHMRLKVILQVVCKSLSESEISIAEFIASRKRASITFGSIMLLLAGVSIFQAPVHSLIFGAGSLAVIYTAGNEGKNLEKELRSALVHLTIEAKRHLKEIRW